MKLTTILKLSAGAAAGYAGARALLSDPELVRVPEPVRPPLLALRTRLLDARARALVAIAEAREERELTRTRLVAEYLDRTEREGDLDARARLDTPSTGAPALPRVD